MGADDELVNYIRIMALVLVAILTPLGGLVLYFYSESLYRFWNKLSRFYTRIRRKYHV